MRVSIILIGLGLALGFSTGVAAQFIPGDINDDGLFDIADTVVLRRALYDLEPGIAQLCGNGLLDPNEDCDFGDLDGATCADFGALAGALACGAGCTFDTSGCTGTGDDHGNNAGSATSVGVPSQTGGNIDVGGDVDWFAFGMVPGVTYTIETSLGTLTDSVLRLYGPNGTSQLAFDDDGGAGLASRIQYTAPSSGTHYAEVRGFSLSQSGTYTLGIQSD